MTLPELHLLIADWKNNASFPDSTVRPEVANGFDTHSEIESFKNLRPLACAALAGAPKEVFIWLLTHGADPDYTEPKRVKKYSWLHRLLCCKKNTAEETTPSAREQIRIFFTRVAPRTQQARYLSKVLTNLHQTARSFGEPTWYAQVHGRTPVGRQHTVVEDSDEETSEGSRLL